MYVTTYTRRALTPFLVDGSSHFGLVIGCCKVGLDGDDRLDTGFSDRWCHVVCIVDVKVVIDFSDRVADSCPLRAYSGLNMHFPLLYMVSSYHRIAYTVLEYKSTDIVGKKRAVYPSYLEHMQGIPNC